MCQCITLSHWLIGKTGLSHMWLAHDITYPMGKFVTIPSRKATKILAFYKQYIDTEKYLPIIANITSVSRKNSGRLANTHNRTFYTYSSFVTRLPIGWSENGLDHGQSQIYIFITDQFLPFATYKLKLLSEKEEICINNSIAQLRNKRNNKLC